MMPPLGRRDLLAAACAWPFAAAGVGHARATAVDVALVLAIDSSSSVDMAEFALQMAGFASAFRDPAVRAAASAGPSGAVAVTMFEWSGPEAQAELVGWTRLADGASVDRFADALGEAPRQVTGGATSISGALLHGFASLAACPFPAERRVIDVSGDGVNNQGFAVARVRDRLIAHGVTINGLAIVNEEPDLLGHFEAEVIGGGGAFALEAADYEDFARAMTLKLLRELPSAVAA
jgi:hypothetical protein